MTPSVGPAPGKSRIRAFAYFVIAVIYFFFSQIVAHIASQFLSAHWSELAERVFLVVLLLVGYGFMGRAFESQERPLVAMGLGRHPGWREEFGRGAAFGWAMLIASILPMLFLGGLLFSFDSSFHQFLVLVFDLVVLLVASLAEEIAFRGYPFQRLIEAFGPFWATLLLSAVFGLAHILNPSSSSVSIVITMVAGWFLSIAYLRTRALWFPWGWHFAWNVSMALLFGLPISGLTRFAPVVQSSTIGPSWLTGGFYGPEASVITLIVMLLAIPVLYLATRSYAVKPAPAVTFSAYGAAAGTYRSTPGPRYSPGTAAVAPAAPPVVPGPATIAPGVAIAVPPSTDPPRPADPSVAADPHVPAEQPVATVPTVSVDPPTPANLPPGSEPPAGSSETPAVPAAGSQPLPGEPGGPGIPGDSGKPDGTQQGSPADESKQEPK